MVDRLTVTWLVVASLSMVSSSMSTTTNDSSLEVVLMVKVVGSALSILLVSPGLEMSRLEESLENGLKDLQM